MKIFNNNSQIELFNNDNIINIVNEEKTIINKQNFLTQLIFTDANTKTTLDTINNIATVTTTVRAATVKIQKADKSNFNTDIEIIGSLTGGRNPSVLAKSMTFPLFVDENKNFKMRFRCEGNYFSINIVDGLINGVNTKLILSAINVYENKKSDSELDIKTSSHLTFENLDTTLLINTNTELNVLSSTGTTNSMKFYSSNTDLISFDGNIMHVHGNAGNCKIYCKNKYSLGAYKSVEILSNVNVVMDSYTRVITTGQELLAKFTVYPEALEKSKTITLSNTNARITENGFVGVTPGDVDIIITTNCESLGKVTKTFNFIVVDDGTLYNNVSRMKKQNLSVGDTYTTNGYFSDNDGGQATYEIMEYSTFLESLPEDIKKINYYSNEVSYDTPVDEYGNHTLNNGLVAKIIMPDNNIIKVEQWGCVGDGRFDNVNPLIHLFAHTKHGEIQFLENGNYYIYGRNKNIAYYKPEKYLLKEHQKNKDSCNAHEYLAKMAPHMVSGYHRGKPCMANITNVILNGNNCTITIPENQFSLGNNDFGIFEFGNDIDGLEIKNFKFKQNGLKQGKYIGWDGKTHEQPTRGHTLFYSDNCSHKWNNVNIHHNEFYENGTPIDISDSGGDFILVINPLESNNVFIEDNYFENWGRWVFAVDLGGNGERFYNYKFNRNRCVQNERNTIPGRSSGNYRGLGWIDFEARKCFTNLEVCDNYVYGINGWAFNGNGKISENVTICRNHTERPPYSWRSAYPYAYEFYSVYTKDLMFCDNTTLGGSMRLGKTIHNMTFKNCNIQSTVGLNMTGNCLIENVTGTGTRDQAFSISSKYNDWLINETSDWYIKPEERETTIIFRNNGEGGVFGELIDKSNSNYYSNHTLIFENNVFRKFNCNCFGLKEFIFTTDQLKQDIDITFAARGCRNHGKTKSIPVDNPIPGGMHFEPGELISDNTSVITRYNGTIAQFLYNKYGNLKGKDLYCTKAGAFPMNGGFLMCNGDNKIKDGTTTSAGGFYFTDDNFYYCTVSGTVGSEMPNHTSGIKTYGTAQFLWLDNMGELELRDPIV